MSAGALQTSLLGTTTLGGRYRPIRRVGSGGMGTVWEADDLVLQRRVAVKLLSPSLCEDETVAARFRREAQAAARLAHPNIAAVFDYGEEQRCPYIVMELVPGRNLRRVLEERGSLSVGEAVGVATQVADALAAAHGEGIVHRDVKPGNVMVADEGRVKVMDFGIADASWFEPITDTGMVMATARYVSPEQATGSSGTPASDVYSLGVVLYEMLAGRPPFDGPSPLAVAAGHAYDVPPPIGRLVPSLPPPLAEIVEDAMHKDPRERPSAPELTARLRAHAEEDRTRVLPVATAGGEAARTLALRRVARARRASTGRPSWLAASAVLVAILVALAAALAFGGDGGRGTDRAARDDVRIDGVLAPAVALMSERAQEPAEERGGARDDGPSGHGGGPDDRGEGPGASGNGNGHDNGHGNAYGQDKH